VAKEKVKCCNIGVGVIGLERTKAWFMWWWNIETSKLRARRVESKTRSFDIAGRTVVA
jgi:hypothetical protein